MSPFRHGALTPSASPFGPFSDDRWRRSPSPELIPVSKDALVGRQPSWSYTTTPETPALSYLSPPPRQKLNLRSSGRAHSIVRSSGRAHSIDGDESTDDESPGPVTPHAGHQAPCKWGWEDSPFKDERWMVESGSDGELGDDAELGLQILPGKARSPGVKGAWADSPFKDDRWRAEHDREELGAVKDGKEWDWGSERLGPDGRYEGPMRDADEGYGSADGGMDDGGRELPPPVTSRKVHAKTRGFDNLKRLLWPGSIASIRPPTKKARSIFGPRTPTSEVDDEDAQDRFWLTSYISEPPLTSPSLQQARLHRPTPDYRTPYPSPPRRSRRTASPDIEPAPQLHLATHLSSRFGHLRMLDAARQLMEEQDMSGLSMFLYCPKRHVREVWGEDKVQVVREGLDRLEAQCPGFKSRVFVHAHETINLACPVPQSNQRSTSRSGVRSPRGSSDLEVYDSTISGLSHEMSTVEKLGLTFLIVHPGSSKRCGGKGDDRSTLRIIATNIDLLLGRHSSITIVLESMTCTSHRLAGTTFASLALIRTLSSYPDRIKFCLDLCHVHSMSHDLSSTVGRASFFDDVDTVLGAGNVVCGHVSECGVAHGSGRDVHADFGSGFIGDSAFRAILAHPMLSHVTWIIETPQYLPHQYSTHRIEALEVNRQAMDMAHLRNLAKMSTTEWGDLGRRNARLQSREKAMKKLRRKMWAEVRDGTDEQRGVGEERRAREERKKRGKLGIARARVRRRAERELIDGGDIGVERSPRRAREALLARERRLGRKGRRGR